ncbi:TQO small subunit DoxD [Formosa sp. S-31]|uniref:TQO small subunit DoxD n=1 Tax=Formosa sp. S-31 TaxID=2790949 RepID=UPI003EBE5CBD
MNKIKQDAGLLVLALRLVVGWTYFSAFWRRTILVDKLDPELTGYIGAKFNHFLPHALGIKPIIQYLVEHPDALQFNMILFTMIEGLVGLFILLGFFTRIMSLGVLSLALGILLGSGWIGTTCLDEWQIGVLGVATGFVLFLTGSEKYSADYYLIKSGYAISKKSWFPWLGSGSLPVRTPLLHKIVLTGSILILALTLSTNQIFHGGLWGPLHNKSVKPKLEISEATIKNDTLSFDIFRTEGVDVYGSWVIEISLLDQQKNPILFLQQNALTTLAPEHISNYYIAKIRPGKHSLEVPLGAKAKIHISNTLLSNLNTGIYTIKITDISGAFWQHSFKHE